MVAEDDLDERIERWLYLNYKFDVANEVKQSIKDGRLTAVWDEAKMLADIRPAKTDG